MKGPAYVGPVLAERALGHRALADRRVGVVLRRLRHVEARPSRVARRLASATLVLEEHRISQNFLRCAARAATAASAFRCILSGI
jgi:hypothetical protein